MTGGVHEHMRAWDPEEDNIIITLLNQLGPKWSRIVQQLPGRSVSSVRNRWQRIEKGRKLREAGQESKNRCQRCGQPKRGHVCTAKLRVNMDRGFGSGGSPRVRNNWEANSDEMSDVPMLSRENSEVSLFRPASSSAGRAVSASASEEEGGSPPPDEAEHQTAASSSQLKVESATHEREMEEAAVPMLGRMRSAGRICSELGFEARRPGPQHDARRARAPRHAHGRLARSLARRSQLH